MNEGTVDGVIKGGFIVLVVMTMLLILILIDYETSLRKTNEALCEEHGMKANGYERGFFERPTFYCKATDNIEDGYLIKGEPR